MSEDRYNGWTNHSTWLVSLHLNNEQYTYHELQTILNSELELSQKVEELKALVESLAFDGMHDESNLFVTDIINSVLSDVNYYEILESNKED